MAEVFPFAGYRYNSDKVKNFNKVVTPPYDKIDESAHKNFLKKSPYNAARLILGDDESKGEEKYQKSAVYLKEWINNNILIKDQKPVFYIYCQEYEINGEKMLRKGIVGLGKLEESKIKAHEKTMAGPKADRLNLLKATETNFGHIFMLYSDPKKRIIKALNSIIKKDSPLISVKDRDQNLHKLWKIENEELQNLIQKYMNNKNLYIADGHHRYQTALNFKQDCENKGYSGDFDKRMMTFINIEDPGLTILATHRLLYGLNDFNPEQFLKDVSRDFRIEDYKVKENMFSKLEDDRGEKNTFGFCAKKLDKYYTLTLQNKELMDKLISDKSKNWKMLDVSVLHKAILEKYLGIGERALNEKKNLEYVRYRNNALERLNNENFQAVFLLNPTEVQEVKKIADNGEKMPQKSTDFYPKLLTGLVYHKLTINK